MTEAVYVLVLGWLVTAFAAHASNRDDVGRRRARVGAWCLVVGSAILAGFAWGHGVHDGFLVVDSESALLGFLASAISALASTIGPRRELSRATIARVAIWTAALQLFFHADHFALLAGAWGLSCLPYLSRPQSPIRRASMHLTATSTLPLVVAVIWAAYSSADLSLGSLSLSGDRESGVLLLVVVAAIARLGVAPLHSWIPRLAREEPTQALVLASPLAGASLLLRLGDALRDAFVVEQPYLEGLGLVSAAYFALVAYGQREQLRSAWALAMSQVSLVFLAVSGEEQGLQGS